MEPPSTPPRPARALPVALVVIGLGALAVWWWATRRSPAGDVAPVASAAAVTSSAPARARVEVRLEASGPGAARVLVDGAALGVITRAADGAIHGEALGRLAFQTRRMVSRDVEVVRASEVDVELALGVQRLLGAGGVKSVLVEGPR